MTALSIFRGNKGALKIVPMSKGLRLKACAPCGPGKKLHAGRPHLRWRWGNPVAEQVLRQSCSQHDCGHLALIGHAATIPYRRIPLLHFTSASRPTGGIDVEQGGYRRFHDLLGHGVNAKRG